jgi:predicted metal-dependent enzyme (double-stranded beta helix superfamily)
MPNDYLVKQYMKPEYDSKVGYSMSAMERMWAEIPQMTLDEARVFLKHITREPQFVLTHILPHALSTARSAEPSIVATYGAREATTCLQVFVWPAGAATPIHDHTAWGAYQCVLGSLSEERYVRVDEDRTADVARLRKEWQRHWYSEDGASTVGSYDAGIHRVTNLSRKLAISVHMYGPRSGALDGRDYDPRRNYVCDRIEGDEFNRGLPALYL